VILVGNVIVFLSDCRHIYRRRTWTVVRYVHYGRNIKTRKLEGLSHLSLRFRRRRVLKESVFATLIATIRRNEIKLCILNSSLLEFHLRATRCHLPYWSHCVTCHPTQVNFTCVKLSAWTHSACFAFSYVRFQLISCPFSSTG